MNPGLTLKFFGKPQVHLDGAPVTGFISAKAQALLYYLATTGRPHSRASLAGLLWGDMPETQAAKNLRNALSNLRSLVGPHLHITREEVVFAHDAPHWLDVAAFRTVLTADLTRQDLSTLHDAVELYQGDFLEGFYVADALAYEEWALGQRSFLKDLVLQGLHTLVARHLERAEHAAGIEYANRLLALEPWREETHRQLMILLVRSRQRSAALAQYERCRHALATELGVTPMPETTALYERIKAAAAPPPHNLPPQPTAFVGRTAELAEIERFLDDPAAQLLTLVGSGGIGKTRLALQAAARCVDPDVRVEPRFIDGVFCVPLAVSGAEPVEPPGSLIAAMADALGFNFHGPVSPQAQLLNFLREKDLLLVLDNFEPLVAEARQLSDILRLAPQVKVLVTSRVRLNLQQEWTLPVLGLEVPGDPGLTPEDAAAYSAVALFVQQARRVQAGFALSAAEVPAVIRICALVEGVPLGIELAASWVRVLTCGEIADEIARGLDFLTTPLQNVPERHRSLRAVFYYSWNLLGADEQTVFRRLAVFRAGFRREAAMAVAGATLPVLARLADHSLVRRTATGRYEIHDLLRQYAEEQLQDDPAEAERVGDAHCRYYAEFLAQHQPQLKADNDPSGAFSAVDVERENVRAAWNWAVSRRRASEVDLFMQCL